VQLLSLSQTCLLIAICQCTCLGCTYSVLGNNIFLFVVVDAQGGVKVSAAAVTAADVFADAYSLNVNTP
jgi:hypothetical protein